MIENESGWDDREIAQVYVSKPKTPNYSDEYRSPQDLKGFTKVLVGQKPVAASVTLNPIDFSYWNTTQKLFVVEPGRYEIHVGASSRDIRLSSFVEI